MKIRVKAASTIKNLSDFKFKEKKVLVRCDFNVPLNEKGRISDDFRIIKTLPTIEYLVGNGAKVILMSHLGKPQEAKNRKEMIQKFSLKPIAKRLEKLLEKKIVFLANCIGNDTEKSIAKMKAGDVVLLENLRFYSEEEKNNQEFAKKLARLGDIYIDDAFGACHRVHASVVGITKYLPSGMGSLLEKEVKVLSNVLENPWRPLVVIIGGVKISTKIEAIDQFLKKADHLLLGGEVANAVLAGKGISLGNEVQLEKEIIDKIRKINLTSPKLHLPIDGIISLKEKREKYIRIGAVGSIKKEEKVFDIGPETITIFSNIIKDAKMILWSGPLGLFEDERFERGTREIAMDIVRNHAAYKIAGGGDTTAALEKFLLTDKFDHVSTGGGAMLEFLSGNKLPGIAALK